MELYKNILIGVHPTAGVPEHVVHRGCALAELHGADLHLAAMVEEKGYGPFARYEPDVLKKAEDEATETLQEVKRKAESQTHGKLNAKLIVEHGAPTQTLMQKVVPDYQIDLVLLPQTSKNKMDRTLMGSFSEAVIRSANCDILIVDSKGE
ncbi:universal stress protein [Marinococcus halophilus]|uniref:Universal stress protein n=1 Tax=Marinococcus halophilus TaxID=1371 RepID=A0A510Y2X1_MARHA|nr:universal stress protein [Marinococcus halophilus]OZT81711.1 universal stress protein [Marinococcus halophilus]GEK57665.1 universal stress protein [Marinococcus halophilus]